MLVSFYTTKNLMDVQNLWKTNLMISLVSLEEQFEYLIWILFVFEQDTTPLVDDDPSTKLHFLFRTCKPVKLWTSFSSSVNADMRSVLVDWLVDIVEDYSLFLLLFIFLYLKLIGFYFLCLDALCRQAPSQQLLDVSWVHQCLQTPTM